MEGSTGKPEPNAVHTAIDEPEHRADSCHCASAFQVSLVCKLGSPEDIPLITAHYSVHP